MSAKRNVLLFVLILIIITLINSDFKIYGVNDDVIENFDDEILENWNEIYGKWSIISEKYFLESINLGNGISILKNIVISDCIIQTTLKFEENTRGFRAGIIFRQQSNTNYYAFEISDEYDVIHLIKYSNEFPDFGNGPPGVSYQINSNTEYILKVQVNGNNFIGYINDKKIISWTDDSYTFGKVGLRGRDSNVFFDDFYLYDFVLASKEYDGLLIIENNETYLIKNVEFNFTGKIIVKDNAKLMIDNSIVLFYNSKTWGYEIFLYNNSILTINNSILKGIDGRYSISLLEYSNVIIKDSQLNFIGIKGNDNSSILFENTYFYSTAGGLLHNSTIKVVNSSFYGQFHIRDNSKASINNSHFNEVECEDNTHLHVSNSIWDYWGSGDVWGWAFIKGGENDSPLVQIENSQLNVKLGLEEIQYANIILKPEYIIYENFLESNNLEGLNFKIIINNTEIKMWGIYSYNSNITISNSDLYEFKGNGNININNSSINNIEIYEDANITIKNTEIIGNFECEGTSCIIIDNCTLYRIVTPSWNIIKQPNMDIKNSIINLFIWSFQGDILTKNSHIETCNFKSGNFYFINCSIDQIYASNKGYISLTNTSINNIKDISEDAILYKNWYLKIITFENNSLKGGIKIDIYDYKNLFIKSNITNNNGVFRFILPEFFIQNNIKNFIGNYTIDVIHYNITKSQKIELNDNIEIKYFFGNVTQQKEPEPEPEPEPEQVPEPKKPIVIPGFTYKSAFLGILISIFLLLYLSRQNTRALLSRSMACII